MSHNPIVQLFRQVSGVDAEWHLGCESGASPSVDNGSRFNDADSDDTVGLPIVIPGKRFDIDTTIVSHRMGRIYTGGGLGRFLGNYTNQNSSAQIVWVGDKPAAYEDMTAVLWQDKGWGNIYRGISFCGNSFHNPASPGTKARIGWHQLPNLNDGSATGGDPTGLNRGKATLEHCWFSDLDIGILFGRDLTDAFDESGEYQMNSNYTGENDNHGDNCTIRKAWFQGLTTGIWVRNAQSAGHTYENLHFLDCPTALYFERGGEMDARQIYIDNGVTLLRLGQTDANVGMYNIQGVIVDGGASEFKLLDCDSTAQFGPVISFKGVNIDSGTGEYPVPIFDVKGGCKLWLERVTRLRPGAIKLTPRGDDSHRNHVIIMGCTLDGCTDQEDVIHEDSTGNFQVDFLYNTDIYNKIFYPNESYTSP